MSHIFLHGFDSLEYITITCPSCNQTMNIQFQELENMILYNDYPRCTCGQTKVKINNNGLPELVGTT